MTRSTYPGTIRAVLLLAVTTIAVVDPASADLDATSEPVQVGDELVFPEGAQIPRGLTAVERAYLTNHPLSQRVNLTPPPEGPVRAVAEYEPMDGVLVAWEGSNSWLAILAQMGAKVTTLGNATFYVAVDTTAEQASARTSLAGAGADLARVQFLVTPTDTIWMRDYGPRYVYQGNVRTIIDHTYNRPRPADDDFPQFFRDYKRHPYHELPLIHGGGNYQFDAVTRGYATRLISNENPSLTDNQIHDLWLSYQGVSTTLLDPFPTNIDTTQHLDMWMQMVADDVVIISDWPFNAGSIQDRICDDAAVLMAARGYTVHRIPARSVAGTHYTYTNVVIVNNLVMIPSYTNGSVTMHNAEALAVWQTASPTRTIVQIPSEMIVVASGVLHCITMQVPAHLGGVNPTVYLQAPRGCMTLVPNAQVELRWVSDQGAPRIST